MRRPQSKSRLATDAQHFMVELEPELLKAQPAPRSKGRWQRRFTLAAWVRFPEGLNQRVALVLVFNDAEGRKTQVVDMCRANRQTLILLNGKIDLQITGEVEDMALVLEGLQDDAVWILDEYRIEPIGGVQALSSQAKSRRIPA